MNIDQLYQQVQEGAISREDFRKALSMNYLETTGKAILDTNRELRTGIPEIVYGEYKTLDQVLDILRNKLQEKSMVLVSRFADNSKLASYCHNDRPVHYTQNLFVAGQLPDPGQPVLIISGGAADQPLAREAELALKAFGIQPILYEDRGIAHPTRVIDALKEAMPQNPRALIAIAGMEASLATFVSSLVPLPVIGVPSSVGYGHKASETALYSMLASCTPNLTVVNTDGAMRAAVVASLIAKQK